LATNLVTHFLYWENQEGLPNLVSAHPLVFLSLILPAFVLAKMATRVQFNRLDILPAFRQIFPGGSIAKTPVTLRIPYSVSHFGDVLARIGFGSAIAPWLIGNSSSKRRGETESWERLSLLVSKKTRITRS
jgi:hypothetical protein